MVLYTLQQISNIVKSNLYATDYYTKEELMSLCKKLIYIKEKNLIGITEQDSQKIIIEKINQFVREKVNVRREYFVGFKGKQDFKYRTAYGALIHGSAICVGYAELTSILLEMYGICSYTMLATLPNRLEPAIHYFVVAEIQEIDGRTIYIPLDPEREASRIRKGDSFERYKEKMLITYPNEKWCKNKLGQTGLGIPGKIYMQEIDYKFLLYNNIYSLIFIRRRFSFYYVSFI